MPAIEPPLTSSTSRRAGAQARATRTLSAKFVGLGRGGIFRVRRRVANVLESRADRGVKRAGVKCGHGDPAKF